MALKLNSWLQQKPPAKLLKWAAERKEMVTYFCRIYTFHAIDGTHSSVHGLLEQSTGVKNIPWRQANGIIFMCNSWMQTFNHKTNEVQY